MTRTFTVQRDHDVTGISGTGPVAHGAVFPDGTTVVRWRELPDTHPHYRRGVRATTVVFPNVEAVEALHGHGGIAAGTKCPSTGCPDVSRGHEIPGGETCQTHTSSPATANWAST